MATTPERTRVRLGTATPGGGFPVYGAAYAAALNEADPTLAVEPVNTKGSTENVPLLEAGQIDIGQVTGEVTYEAMTGVGRPPAKLYIVSAMYPSAGMFIVRADSPYRTLADLTGQPVVWGARGSGLVVLARYVFDGLGLDLDRDFQAVYLDKAGDGPPMVLDGRAAGFGAAAWAGRDSSPWRRDRRARASSRPAPPTSRASWRSTPSSSRSRCRPAATRGRTRRCRRSGRGRSCCRGPSLPEDVAYRLARALHRGEAALGARLAQARESTLANTLAAAPRPDSIHPGVRRYMRGKPELPRRTLRTWFLTPTSLPGPLRARALARASGGGIGGVFRDPPEGLSTGSREAPPRRPRRRLRPPGADRPPSALTNR